jgi:uncharacterized membrane protein YciS (DUF1049 family)
MGKRLKVPLPEHEDPKFISGPRRTRSAGQIAAGIATALFIIGFLAAMVIFMALNFTARVENVKLFPGKGHVFESLPLVIIVPFSIMCGILFASLLGMATRIKQSLVNRGLQRRIRRMEKEMEELKASMAPVPSEAVLVLENGRSSHQGD